MTAPVADAAAPGGAARLFFALWPELDVRNALAAWQRKLHQGGNAKVVRPWTLHLTLAFLGLTPEDRIDAAKDAAAGVRGQAFDMLLDQAGYWPHNRIVWAGCSAPPPALVAMQSTLVSRLSSAAVAFDAKTFFPHVTLLRDVRSAKSEWAQSSVAWPVRNFVLVESKPGKDGSRYEIMARFPLR